MRPLGFAGAKAALSVLLVSLRRVEQQGITNRNALDPLVRPIDLGLHTRRTVTDKNVAEIEALCPHTTDGFEQQITRQEAIDLARGITAGAAHVKLIKGHLTELDEQLASGVQG